MEYPDKIAALKNELITANTSEKRIRILYDLAGEYIDKNNLEAEQFAYQALQISRDIRSSEYIPRTCLLLGSIKLRLSDLAGADKFLNEGLSYLTKKGSKRDIAAFFNSLGYLFEELEEFDLAMEYYQKSDSLFTRIKLVPIASIIRLNIGNIYNKTNKADEAYSLFLQLIAYFQAIKDTSNLIPAYIGMAEACLLKNLSDSAEYYCLKSLSLSQKRNSNDNILESNLILGKIYNNRFKFNESNEFMTYALELADSFKSKSDYAEITKYMSENYAALKDSGKAYFYLSLNNKFQNKPLKQETYKNITKRQLEVQNKISQTRTKLLYITLVCLLISVLLIITLYLNYRIKKKANRLLTEMDELKSRLFSNLTHEFRTPLTLILGPLEEMLSEGEKRNLSRHEIKLMRKNAKRLLNLVNQMLDLAKLDAKSMKIELVEDDFVKFFKMIVTSFSTAAEQKGIRFTWTVPKESFPVFFDADKLEKVISNIVSNALKYTDRGGEVTCRLEIPDKKKELVRFIISDSGKGIKADHLHRIFDRFYQAEQPGPDSFSTGIGLSLTKELITLLDGEIEVKSEWGKGSAFTVTLPLGFKHLDKTEFTLIETHKTGKSGMHGSGVDFPEESETAQMESGEKKNLPVVLIAEDQSEIRGYMTDHLQDDFRMMQAENGAKAFDLAVQNIPDLVITDLIMPEMDGMELCRRLKTDERTSHIPVIMLTARTGMEDKLQGLETGADQYLTKPFHMKELRIVVRKLIEQRNILRERFRRDVRLEPKDIAITPADEKFLNRALAVIEKHMGDYDFEVSTFQGEMAMSRMQLFRKIKALTGQTPGEFVRTIRLKRAAKLIEQGFGNIAQVCFEVGFNNPSYFAKCFRDMYGSLPSEFAGKNKHNHSG